jgi:hypothetical protein
MRPPSSRAKLGLAPRTIGLLLVVVVVLSLLPLCSGLKHSYKTNKNEERTLIGPIGLPFGFLNTGQYNITVFDFDLSIGVHPENEEDDEEDDDDDLRERSLSHPLDEIEGVGFLLKKFKDEADFTQYISWTQADASRCVFEPFMKSTEDDELFADQDDDREEYGQVLDVEDEGIFLSMKEQDRWAPATPSIAYDFEVGEEGLYFLIYQICPSPSMLDIHSRFELDFHFLNYDAFGNKSYLSAGEMALPHLFFAFSLIYAVCLYLWYTNITRIKEGGPGHFSNPGGGRPTVFPIHSLMTALLFLKTLAIFFESIRYHYLRVTGHAEFWSGVYYTFAFMKGTLLFTVILLIGSGWSFVKPFLSDREKKMIFAILFFQFVNNIAIIVLTQETEGERSFDHWTAILHMVDILCCCAVLIPIVWQVNALEKNMEQSNGDHNDDDIDDDCDDDQIPEDEMEEKPRHENGRLAAKLRLFRSFYLLVVSYIYITRIVVYLFATMLDYRHQWIRHFVVEAVTLAFFITVGMLFRPMGENPYLSIKGGASRREAELELT